MELNCCMYLQTIKLGATYLLENENKKLFTKKLRYLSD